MRLSRRRLVAVTLSSLVLAACSSDGIRGSSDTSKPTATASTVSQKVAEDALCDELPSLQRMFRAFAQVTRNGMPELVGQITAEETSIGEIADLFEQAGDEEKAADVRNLEAGLDEIRKAILKYLDDGSEPRDLPDTTSLTSEAYLGVKC